MQALEKKILYCKIIQFKPSVAFKNNYFGCIACGVLVPQPGTEPTPMALEVLTLNPWTASKVPMAGSLPSDFFFFLINFILFLNLT